MPTTRTATGRFSVWNGSSINPYWQSLDQIHEAIASIKPCGYKQLEWIVKAGEGGTWQSAWDSNPLAISGPDQLATLYTQGKALKLKVTPYVVIRGRPEWNDAEWQQIAQCVQVCRRVVLNLEPGDEYWNGPTDPTDLNNNYIAPMWNAIQAVVTRRQLGVAQLELACIPRQSAVDTLGGVPCLQAWQQGVNAMSWECYDATAPDLAVDASIARVQAWLPNLSKGFYRPIVQQSRIDAWSHTKYADSGLEVWHLDGD